MDTTMNIILKKVVPEPIKDRLSETPSDVWGKDLVISNDQRILFRAPSGKGKSTFVHILYGLRKDFNGNAQWENENIVVQTEKGWSQWRSKELSIVFQDLRLFPELTIAENMSIKLALGSDVNEEQIKKWLTFLGLEKKWGQKAETLSYGERQRVAIVRSLIQPFVWLLLDEPFSHLDNENIAKASKIIWDRVQQLNAGMLVVDLEDNDWFAYTQKLLL